jgi:tRNA(adenine34) deaminase
MATTPLDYQTYLIHRQWMNKALELAGTAGSIGEIPVGAIIVDRTGNVLAATNNRKQRDGDPTAHAEILAIRAASRVKAHSYLNDCTLYVTLEPCPMCAGAIVQARLALLVYGADDPKTGAIRTVIDLPNAFCSNHHPNILAGIQEARCRQQLQSWFVRHRSKDPHIN